MMNSTEELIQLATSQPARLINTLVDDACHFLNQNQWRTNALCSQYGPELKFLLQTKPELFWQLWDKCEHAQTQSFTDNSNDIKHSEITDALKKNGIVLLNNFFDNKILNELQTEWQQAFSQLPPLNDAAQSKALRNRFCFEQADGCRYVQSSSFDGKKRILFLDKDKTPSAFAKNVLNNELFTAVTKEYFRLPFKPTPTFLMAEHLTAPQWSRNDMFWHIDNLSDQFKVMVILEDMTEDDAPFTYIEGSHNITPSYHERYHKMYAMNGMVTQEHNHFETSFASSHNAKKAILKAGDVVLFDCKIHHSASFAQNNGKRKNLVIYYNDIPTIRNTILQNIDSYLNFGLR